MTFFQLLSEFIILSISITALVFEYRRQSEKEEKKQADVEQEKMELREQVNNIALTVEQQSAQIRELTRVTFALRDDLEKANKKNSGFLGFGGGTGSKGETKEVSFDETIESRPIIRAVLHMNLHTL